MGMDELFHLTLFRERAALASDTAHDDYFVSIEPRVGEISTSSQVLTLLPLVGNRNSWNALFPALNVISHCGRVF